jgi:hypothetical protein
LTFHIFGALAEFEQHLIQEHTQAGLRVAHARGRFGGRPKALPADKRQLAVQAIGQTRKSQRCWSSKGGSCGRGGGRDGTPTAKRTRADAPGVAVPPERDEERVRIAGNPLRWSSARAFGKIDYLMNDLESPLTRGELV